ncbi:unnamed protein product [Parascedosporium putredinis]|uniref:Adenosine kinase n=1 Tax=Parascedosporium putredinis TaxID=1442378 RepID=A0A9P1MDA6_9PEZI|nr:unnamed protein product [Parascedosporium putredinis]CAI8003249.1 unnamed protein product [Parascedosporium putredinis]
MATKEYALLCLENPLLDIQAFGDDALLEKYGLKANDAILAEDKHLPIYEDLLNNYDAKLLAGGAAQNSARGAQVEYRVDPKAPTGRCGAIITGHNRSLCTALDAANNYDLDHLKKPEIWALAQNADIFYVGGFHFTVCPPAIMELGKLAAAENKAFIVNLSAPFIPQFFKDVVDASAPYWDYIIGNETEDVAKHLANLPKENSQRKRVAIVTQGTDPTLIAVQGEDTIREIPVHAIEKDKIVDTNGAGDAFAGGFLAGLVEGKPLETAVDMGQWLARLSIQELGPSFPTPKQAYTSQ